ncbi:MAG: cell wall metabolism sensor histidine kinase WalK [Candidatus Eremiobacteraeota bacterium]|nr:cell wall metabolism sensor histidine kinase WalK [Candidatus Eremiobacteraeota bacterium]
MKISFIRSIWFKLTLCFIGFVILTLFIFGAGILLTALTTAGFHQRDAMMRNTRETARLIKVEEGKDGKLENVMIPLKSLGNSPRISTFIFDTEGKIIEKNLSRDNIDFNMTQEEIKKLNLGEELSFPRNHKNPDRRFYVSASPIKKEGSVIGSYVMILPLANPPDVRKKIRSAFNRSFIMAVLISSLVALFLARTLTKPIRAMENKALEISKGNFSKKLNLKRKDEIGALAHSLDEMSEKLDQNIKQRLYLMANISHEIRTPLATIQGCTEAILDGIVETDEEKERYLNTIKNETGRMSVLLKDLTDLSRFEMGEIKLAIEPFCANSAVKKAVDGVEVFALKKKIDMDMSLPDNDLFALGDEDRIIQTLLILLDNAVHHIPGGRKIVVSINRVGKMIRFSVSDNGDGIQQEDLPYIFDRFYKADKSRTRKKTGSGLGLAIARQIIKSHGSDISVKSSTGGSEFAFTLPVVPHPAVPLPAVSQKC